MTDINFYGLFLFQVSEVVSDLRELTEAALINSTPVHLTPNVTGTGDVHYFLDIEMATLGGSPGEYAKTLVMMRNEYGCTSDDDYFELRIKVRERTLLLRLMRSVQS